MQRLPRLNGRKFMYGSLYGFQGKFVKGFAIRMFGWSVGMAGDLR
jgi:hypothetical protein